MRRPRRAIGTSGPSLETLEPRLLLSATTALSADALIDSIGVNTRFEFGNDQPYLAEFATTKQKLDDLDIRWIRDKIPNQTAEINAVMALYNDLGIQTTHIFNRDVDQGGGAAFISNELDRVRPYQDAILAFEGPNEYDLSDDPNKWPHLRGYVEEIWNEVRSDADFSDYVIVGPSMSQSGRYDGPGDMGQWMDYSNIHPYPGGEAPTNNLGLWISEVTTYSDGKMPWATETGYHNATNWTGGNAHVSEDGAADYINRLYIEYFARGIERTAYYTLWDHGNNLAQREDMFGLLNYDGSEKPAFVALENMIDLLKDPGADFTPGSLDYDLEGDVEDLRHYLFQKSDGTFWLAIWNGVDVYDQGAKTDIINPDANITLTFNDAVTQVKTYLPKNSATATATHNSPDSLNLGIPDHVMLLEITPANTADGQAPYIQSNQADGLVSIEAENHTRRETGTLTDRWIELKTDAASGDGAMIVSPDTGDVFSTGSLAVGNAAHMEYQINFAKTGTHYVWLRGLDMGLSAGGGDSVHIGLNGAAVSSADSINGFSTSGWQWSKTTLDGPVATINISEAGLHTLDVWMREDGFALDKIVLTTSSSYTPTGDGPSESAQPGDIEASPFLSFTDRDFTHYGTQDTGGRVLVSNDDHRGNVISLNGNDWKATPYGVSVASDTVLEFDFRSSDQSELNAIGLAGNNASARSTNTFKIWGTESWGRAVTQYNGSGDWQTYSINVGEYFTGNYNYLTFVNDNDAGTGESEFRNIRFYNSGSAGTAPSAPSTLSASSNDDTSIQLTWADNSSNETAFVLERSVSSTFDQVTRITLEPGRTSYLDVNLKNNTTYHYRIRATNVDGDSAYSSTTSATTGSTPVNQDPVAVNDSASTNQDTAVTINVLSNDSDPDTDPLNIASVTQGSNGTVTNNGNNVTYTPNTGWTGTDNFTYTISDGNGGSDTASVSVAVNTAATGTIDFSSETIYSYGNQDIDGTATVQDGGATLKLEGNTWKAIQEPVVITNDTILEFDFKSAAQGEVHGIGVASAIGSTRSYLSMTFWGPETYGDRTSQQYDGSGNWMTFQITLSDYISIGSYSYLTFINDHDVASPTGEGYYRNVRVYEEGTPPASPAAPNNLAASATGTSSIDVSWTDNASDEDNIVLQRADNSGFTGATEFTLAANTTSYNDTGLSENTTYYYRVKATNTGGDSAWSATASAITDTATDTIDFSAETIYSYGSQDGSGTATVEDSGATLKLEGNTWKAIAEGVTITSNTILEFDFKSTSQGEVHGIGVANGIGANRSYLSMTLWGPETYGDRTSQQYDGSGDWMTFQITLSDYISTGSYNYLTFINDHDVANPTGNSFFRNVRVYEG